MVLTVVIYDARELASSVSMPESMRELHEIVVRHAVSEMKATAEGDLSFFLYLAWLIHWELIKIAAGV